MPSSTDIFAGGGGSTTGMAQVPGVVVAHEAEVVGRILDRIDALHQVHDHHLNACTTRCQQGGRCQCGSWFYPCPTRRLTAEIRGEMSHG